MAYLDQTTNKYMYDKYRKEETEIRQRTHTIDGFTYVPLKKKFLFGDYESKLKPSH